MCARNADWAVTLLGIRVAAAVVRTAEARGDDVRARGARGAGGGGGSGLGIPWMHVLSGRSQSSQYSSATRPSLRGQGSGAVSTFLVNFSVAGAQSSALSGVSWVEDFTATA